MSMVRQYSYHNRIFTYRRVEEKRQDEFYDKTKTCCFTGHRPVELYGYDDERRYQHITDKLVATIKSLYTQGVCQFITGGAQGIDQLAFWAVHSVQQSARYKDIINTIYVPFEGQESRWVADGIFGQQAYRVMCNNADRVRVVNRNVDPGNTYAEICKALDERNKAMLKDSSLLIAWYNGKLGGGTYNCIQDAKVRGLEVINLYEKEPRRIL